MKRDAKDCLAGLDGLKAGIAAGKEEQFGCSSQGLGLCGTEVEIHL